MSIKRSKKAFQSRQCFFRMFEKHVKSCALDHNTLTVLHNRTLMFHSALCLITKRAFDRDKQSGWSYRFDTILHSTRPSCSTSEEHGRDINTLEVLRVIAKRKAGGKRVHIKPNTPIPQACHYSRHPFFHPRIISEQVLPAKPHDVAPRHAVLPECTAGHTRRKMHTKPFSATNSGHLSDTSY